MRPQLYSLNELQNIIAREYIISEIHRIRAKEAENEGIWMKELIEFFEHDSIRDEAIEDFEYHVVKN